MNKKLEQSPKEWNKVPIGSMAKSQAGGTPSTLIESYWGGAIPWMSSGELNKKQVYNTEEYITDSGLQNSSAKIIPKHSVLIGLAGQGKTRGTVAMNYIPLATNQSVAAIFPSKEFDPWFLYHNLNLRYHEIRGMSTGEGGRGGLNLNIINSILVLLPPLEEQKAIARVLSNADQLILATEELIEKKKKIKKSLMQELLTGKTRLPGFIGEWEEMALGDVADMNSGGTPDSNNRLYYGGGILWASIADMTKGGKYISQTDKTLTEAGLQDSAAVVFPAGTVLYAMYASIGECSIATLPISSSQAILGIRVNQQNLYNEFLYYLLFLQKDNIKTLGQQGTQSNLNAKLVKDISVSIPPLEEQKAIARVLSRADQEIGLLEEKLIKYKKIKQGMMQELLTGKTRLPEFRP